MHNCYFTSSTDKSFSSDAKNALLVNKNISANAALDFSKMMLYEKQSRFESDSCHASFKVLFRFQWRIPEFYKYSIKASEITKTGSCN